MKKILVQTIWGSVGRILNSRKATKEHRRQQTFIQFLLSHHRAERNCYYSNWRDFYVFQKLYVLFCLFQYELVFKFNFGSEGEISMIFCNAISIKLLIVSFGIFRLVISPQGSPVDELWWLTFNHIVMSIYWKCHNELTDVDLKEEKLIVLKCDKVRIEVIDWVTRFLCHKICWW